MKLKNVVDGGWYAAYNYLRGLKKVIECRLFNTMSSSGSWEG